MFAYAGWNCQIATIVARNGVLKITQCHSDITKVQVHAQAQPHKTQNLL